ncbi:hypothetical protein FACS1894190_08440 [Spirochaetia bacterium]|nr:hypothetical protein FACS1894190_08440 [Spirochaetia bacterium]
MDNCVTTKRKVRFFNTTGPCNPYDHYMLPPAERLIGAQLARYIRDKLYWVLHAPRQTGKTTFLQTWAREINAGSDAVACYVSVEECQGVLERGEANQIIYEAICRFANWAKLPVPEIEDGSSDVLVSITLARWAKLVAPKSLIVLFDEVDVISGDALISFLRQLRGGFAEREVGKFPISIALVGMRDLKDYITASKDGKAVNPGSPFNIKEDSAVIGNFNKTDIQNLFLQRTEETGQQITENALDYVWEQSCGQPWLVNSLFKRATMRILNENDYSTVTIEHIKKVRDDGLKQTAKYRDTIDSSASSYLVIFDRRSEGKKPGWDDRLTWDIAGDITVVGC